MCGAISGEETGGHHLHHAVKPGGAKRGENRKAVGGGDVNGADLRNPAQGIGDPDAAAVVD
jgi:hypothetical protein